MGYAARNGNAEPNNCRYQMTLMRSFEAAAESVVTPPGHDSLRDQKALLSYTVVACMLQGLRQSTEGFSTNKTRFDQSEDL